MKGAVPLEPKAYTFQDTLSELDALEKPEGVKANVWDELKGALREALESRARTNDGSAAVSAVINGSEVGGRDTRPTDRIVSSPPTGAANKVNDLTATRETNGDFTLSWHYRNLGDYDQNGVVGVSDITPLAMHYNETYDTQTESESIQAVIDGSGNAKIGVEDVTQIAQNFGVAVVKYSVRGSDAYAGPFAETAIIGVNPQVSDARKVLTTNLGASPQGYWQVVPQDAENAQGEASNIAGISLQIRSVTPTSVKEGTVVTFSADVLGAGPFTYDWDFGGQAVPATSTEASPKVVLTRDTGEFSARLTVTNYIGNAAYPFTLTKLAREWKYEAVLNGVSNEAKGFCLQYEGSDLWFYAHDGGSPAHKYLIHGMPDSWQYEEITQRGDLVFTPEGNPAFLYADGAAYNMTLFYSEKLDSVWHNTPLNNAWYYGAASICVSKDAEVFIAFNRTSSGIDPKALDYSRRSNGEWETGTISTDYLWSPPGTEMMPMDAGPDLTPIMTFRMRAGSATPEFRYAAWNEATQSWDIGLVERDGDNGTDTTGYFPDIKYGPDGRAGCAFSSRTSEIVPGTGNDRLVFGRLETGVWQFETVQERTKPDGVTNSYEWKALTYDPLGNPVIAYLYYRGPDVTPQRGVIVEWKTSGGWVEYPVCLTDDVAYQAISVAFDEIGNLYVLYGNRTNEEVVIARYE